MASFEKVITCNSNRFEYLVDGGSVIAARPVSSSTTRHRRQRVTLLDVAKHAGLSRTTVSEVLSRPESESLYAEATRQRVLSAANELGYAPHGIAQKLARGRSGILGLILLRDFSNPYFARLADVVDREVRKRNMRLQIAVRDCDAEADEATCFRHDAELVRQMQSDAVEGLLLGPVYEQLDLSQHEPLASGKLPTVLFGGSVAGFDGVGDGEEAGRSLAIDHLIELGHRRIGFLCAPPNRIEPTRDDHLVPLRLLREKGVLAGAQWIGWQPDTGRLDDFAEAAEAYAEQWLAAPEHARPTAVLCLNDAAAMTALGALARRGVSVPDDLSVLGYDNNPEAPHLVPPLTTVDNDLPGQVSQAVSCLLDRIANPGQPPEYRTVEPRLVVRASARRI